MKNISRFCLLIIVLMLGASAMGQAPQRFGFQAVARDASGRLMNSQPVGLRVSILQGTPTGTMVYAETHTVTTNSNGLFSVNVGEGSVFAGTFSAINWANGPYYIKSEIDVTGGTNYTLVSTQQMISVPYALHAFQAERLATPIVESQILSIRHDTIFLTGGSFVKLPAGFSGSYNDLTNKPTIPTVPTNVSAFTNDAGYLTSFTESQVLSIGHDTVYLTGGSFVVLPAGFSGNYNDLTNKPTIPTTTGELTNDAGFITSADVPAVPTNVSAFTNDAGYLTSFTESQVLSIGHDTVYLTGGSFVVLPAGFSGNYNDLTNKPTIPTTTGELTNDAGFITSADVPTVPTNVSAFTNDAGYLTSFTESQVLSIGHDTVYLTGGSFVVLPAGFSGNYNDLTNKPTIPTVPTNVSAFTNDAGYLTSFTESQVLSISHDTVYLTGGSFVVLPAGFSGNYNDLTNKPTIPTTTGELTNDAGFITSADVPTVPTNVSAFTNDAGYLTSFTESQVLSIGHDTVYLTGGSFVVLPAGFSGNYNDLTNKPTIPAVPTNVSAFTNDAGYLTSFTESQVLSIGHDTVYLTGGSFVVLPAGFSGNYNDLTNKPTIPTTTGELTNDAGFITSTDVPTVPTNVSAFINDAGYLTSFTESQVLSIGHDTVYLTGGSFVVLPAGFSGNYNDLTNKPTIPTTTGELTNDAGFITSADVPTVPTNVSAFTNDAGYLTSFTESQVLSIGHDTVYLTGGSFVVLPAGFSGNYNDLTNKPTIPTVPTNVSAFTNDAGYLTSFAESQVLSIGHDTVYLTGGSFVVLPAGFSGNYNDLTNKPTIPTVPTNVSAFTNDAGYLTSFTESQVLSIGHDTVYLTGGSFVVLPAGFSGNYNDLTNKPTIPTTTGELTNDAGFITSADVPTVPTNVSAFTNDAGYLTSFTESQVLSIGHDTVYLTGGSFVVLPAGFSGNYNDLTNKPTIPTTTGELTNDAGFITSADVPTVPTNVSAFTNDAGYLTSFTESQVLSIGHDTVYLTGGSFVVLPAGFSGNYNDLTNKPTIPAVPTNVSAFTNDAGYLTSFTESQVLSIGHDTVYLTGGSFVVLPAGFSGNYNDLTNKPTIPTTTGELTNDAGFITSADVPAVPTNVSAFTNDAGYLTSFAESQVLSIGHDTVYLTGGSFVVLPAGFSGNYNDLTNKPTIPAVPTNVSAFTNDAGYLTSFTESQVLSIGHDTVYLTGGSFVVLPAGFSGNYNDLTNKPTIPTTTGELTNDAGFITSADVPTVPTNVSAFTNDAGYLTSFTESQVLSIGHDTVYLTGGSFVVLPAGFSGNYNDLTNKPTIPAVPTNVSAFTNDAGYLTSFTESQVLSIGHDTVYLTGGSFVVLPAGFSGNYNDLTNKPTIPTTTGELTNDAGFITSADVPAVPTNVSAFTNDAGYLTSFTESQVLSIGHDTVYLTGGSFVVLPAGFSGNYNDLTNKPTIPTVPSNVSSFTNDAGYLTSYSETQSLADVVANGSSAGHSQIKNVNDPTEAKDAVNLQYLMAQLARMQHQIDSLGAVVASLGSGGEAPSANGALPGAFSVSSTNTVKFSQGNLQYQASTDTWRFAENQYDIIGSANSNISSTYTGWIDLFGWGTSGYHDPSDSYNTRYQPYSTENSTVNSTYNYYGYGPSTNQPSPNLTGTSANYDWGVYNPISNGGNQAGQWRTLTKAEWNYLFFARSASTVNGTANARYCKAQVNGVSGIVVFPDSYTHPAGVTQPVSINTYSASYTSNTYTASQWTFMQVAGAVFLPATGYRDGTSVYNVGMSGGYWSASYCNSSDTYTVSFNDSGISTTQHHVCNYGLSVRLVQDSSVSLTITACDHYLWHGNDYTTSGDYTNGVETLHLTINQSTHNSESQTVPVSYTWHDTDYSSTGTYTYEYTNLEGCPSTDTLHLNINPTPSSQDFTVNGVTFNMIRVEGGTFNMGSQRTDPGAANYDLEALPYESPVHSVTLNSYYIGQTEVTQGLWDAVMGVGSPSHGTWSASEGLGSSYPAYRIDYDSIQSFLTRLNSLTGMNFRVPTEAEWEYAARGGNQSEGYKYSGSNTIEDVAWCTSNSSGTAHPVATKQANELGIYDMSGNVWEWCADLYGDYNSTSASSSRRPYRVDRGGSWFYSADNCRLSLRDDYIDGVYKDLGFRLALSGFTSTVLPTVTAAVVSSIASTTATSSSEVTTAGGAAVTARGVCWGTDINPTISGSHTTNGTGEGSFTSSITGLTPGITYHIRAYATNSVGTSYGEDRTFTTSVEVPTVTTNAISNITSITAVGGGNVTSTGGATVTARGVCWGTSENPTISDSHTTDGAGTGTFTSSITGLTAGTTYHVRAYASNSVGTSYGEDRTFTTSVEVPTVTTNTISNITSITAVGGGNVTSTGGATVTARGICWGTSASPTITGNHTTNGTGIGSFASSMTGLTPGMTYYVRAYATNSAGTAYGAQVTFTAATTASIVNGALPGLFRVSSTRTVKFSRGNLQYTTSGSHAVSTGGTAVGTWRFASHQYDIIGSGNHNISATYTGYIDLFGYGTSGWNSGAYYYLPYSSGNTGSNNVLDGQGYYHESSLTGTKADWGEYNAISNGGNTPGQWRTLSDSEWNYLLKTRSTSVTGVTSGARYCKATIGSVTGLIVFPDVYNHPTGHAPVISNTNTMDVAFSVNIITTGEWSYMEAAGAVFLPCAGKRSGTSVLSMYTGTGYYWTATLYGYKSDYPGSYCAKGLCFNSSSITFSQIESCHYGKSVRLVKDN